MTSLNNLSELPLAKVFGFLDRHTALNARQTCQAWKQIHDTYDVDLWRHLLTAQGVPTSNWRFSEKTWEHLRRLKVGTFTKQEAKLPPIDFASESLAGRQVFLDGNHFLIRSRNSLYTRCVDNSTRLADRLLSDRIQDVFSWNDRFIVLTPERVLTLNKKTLETCAEASLSTLNPSSRNAAGTLVNDMLYIAIETGQLLSYDLSNDRFTTLVHHSTPFASTCSNDSFVYAVGPKDVLQVPLGSKHAPIRFAALRNDREQEILADMAIPYLDGVIIGSSISSELCFVRFGAEDSPSVHYVDTSLGYLDTPQVFGKSLVLRGYGSYRTYVADVETPWTAPKLKWNRSFQTKGLPYYMWNTGGQLLIAESDGSPTVPRKLHLSLWEPEGGELASSWQRLASVASHYLAAFFHTLSSEFVNT